MSLCADAPVLTESIETPLAIRGSDVTLKCKGDGNPPVTFQWFKVVNHFLILISLPSTLAVPYRLYRTERVQRDRSLVHVYC